MALSTRRGAVGAASPRAVIVVHLYGQPADMDAIVEICARHEVPLIEDAAESLGAAHKGRHKGTIGRFGWSSAGEWISLTRPRPLSSAWSPGTPKPVKVITAR